MFGAPNRTDYDLCFSVLGIPVRVHPMFWLVSAILGFGGGDPAHIMIWIGVMFVSILVHELGHAFTMRYFGFNPSVALYAGGGLAMYQSVDSPWSSYGVNHPRRESPWTSIIISAAGPAAGFALATLVIIGVIAGGISDSLLGEPDATAEIASAQTEQQPESELGEQTPPGKAASDKPNELLMVFIFYMLFINIFWGLVNLLPIYPLDGGQITREIVKMINPYDGVRISLWISLVTAAGVAILGINITMFITFMFGYFAFMNWQMLQATGGGFGGGGFGGGGGYGGGGRPW